MLIITIGDSLIAKFNILYFVTQLLVNINNIMKCLVKVKGYFHTVHAARYQTGEDVE